MSPRNSKSKSKPIQQSEPLGVHTIHISDSSQQSKTISPEFLAEAITYLHRDGILILANAIDPTHLDTLRHLLNPEALEISKNPSHHFNFGRATRNIDQAPPLRPELMYDDVWCNPFAVAILSQTLGPNPVLHYANGNTALPGATARQPVHSDIDGPHPNFPFAYAVNVPLCDMDAENGSTEVWVGSHRGECVEQHVSNELLTIKPSLVEERRACAPPVQPATKKGSLIIRDLRLWHAGMPNRSAEPRIMLAFVLQPKWCVLPIPLISREYQMLTSQLANNRYLGPSKVLMPEKTKPLVEKWREETGMEVRAEWVEGEVDHRLVSSEEVDFGTTNTALLGLMHLPAH
jgi:Phytanoyl-CoA dioxygenase (PhyH)